MPKPSAEGREKIRFIARVASTWDCGRGEALPLRAFYDAQVAREWIESLNQRMGKRDDFIEEACLYRIRRSGTLELIDRFGGGDRGDGFVDGWENACKWISADQRWGCGAISVKGQKLCAYHRRSPQYANPDNTVYAYNGETKINS